MSLAPSEQAMSQGDKEPGRWKGAQRASNEPESQQETMQVAREPARSQGANNEPGNQQGATNGQELQQGGRGSKVPKRQP